MQRLTGPICGVSVLWIVHCTGLTLEWRRPLTSNGSAPLDYDVYAGKCILKVLPRDTHWLIAAKRPSRMDHSIVFDFLLETGIKAGDTIKNVSQTKLFEDF